MNSIKIVTHGKYEKDIDGIKEKCDNCNNTLEKQLITKNIMVYNGECSHCSGDRVFSLGGCGNDCKKNNRYEDKLCTILNCDKCEHASCDMCKCKTRNYTVKRCNSCIDKKEYYKEKERLNPGEFSNKWNGSIEDKLNCYGIAKLKILATKKGITTYDNMRKKTLIKALTSITTESDFPIRQ